MKYSIVKIIGIFLTFNLIISGGSGQEFVGDYNIYYSDKLKMDMEFTWEIIKFNFNFNDSLNDGSNELPTDSTTTITGSDGSITVIVDSSDQIEIPEIKPGTRYTVKLLKDIGNLTQEAYWENYDGNQDEYFEVSFSDPNIDTSTGNFGPEGFIEPNTIRFKNGTVLNFYEYRIDQLESFRDSYPDDYQFDYYIEDGVFVETNNFSAYNNFVQMELRIDVETGILLYISLFQNITGFMTDLEMRLDQTEGINIDAQIANDDPNLSLPLSAAYVYSLIIITIIISKTRKQTK